MLRSDINMQMIRVASGGARNHWLLSSLQCGDRNNGMFHQANSRARYNRAAFRYWSPYHARSRVETRAFVHPNFSDTNTNSSSLISPRWLPVSRQRRRQHLKARRRARPYLLLSRGLFFRFNSLPPSPSPSSILLPDTPIHLHSCRPLALSADKFLKSIHDIAHRESGQVMGPKVYRAPNENPSDTLSICISSIMYCRAVPCPSLCIIAVYRLY